MKFLDNDHRDQTNMHRRFLEREAIKGPREGDYVIYPDGRSERISHDWGTAVQTSEGGSFFLGDHGYVSFSGGLNPSVPKKKLRETGRFLDGRFWFFHHDWMRASNGVDFALPCRVFELNGRDNLPNTTF